MLLNREAQEPFVHDTHLSAISGTRARDDALVSWAVSHLGFADEKKHFLLTVSC